MIFSSKYNFCHSLQMREAICERFQQPLNNTVLVRFFMFEHATIRSKGSKRDSFWHNQCTESTKSIIINLVQQTVSFLQFCAPWCCKMARQDIPTNLQHKQASPWRQICESAGLDVSRRAGSYWRMIHRRDSKIYPMRDHCLCLETTMYILCKINILTEMSHSLWSTATNTQPIE
jgi:hypothetical protein